MDEQKDEDDVVYKLAQIGEIGDIYNFYIIMASICILLLFVEILDYFKFSRNMNTLLMVISRGKSTMLFFVVIYIIMLFGFSIGGFIIFGPKSHSYRTIGYSFLNTFRIAPGNFEYEDIRSSDYIVAPIFFVIVKLFFSLILLSILTSIVVVGYEETVKIIEMDAKGEKQKGIIELIENELQREFDMIEEQYSRNRSQMSPKDYKNLIISKMPLKYWLFSKIRSMEYILPTPKEELVTIRAMVEKKSRLSTNRETQRENELLSSIETERENKVTANPFIQRFRDLEGENAKAIKVKSYDPTKLEKNQVAIWRNAVEEALRQKSDNKLKLFDFLHNSSEKKTKIEFYPKRNIEELSSEMKNFIFANRMSFKQRKMWEEADLQKKYEFWCAMDTTHSEYYLEVNKDKEFEAGVTTIREEKDETKIDKKPTNKRDGMNKEVAKEDNKVDINSYKESDKESDKEIERIKKEEEKKEEKQGEEERDICELKRGIIDESLSDEEAKDIPEVIVGSPLIPRDINLTIKGMLNSPEYSSSYARTISDVQRKYWNKFTIEEKLELWLFKFTGKQRAKLWKQFQFSKENFNEFIEKSPLDLKRILGKHNNVHDLWINISNGLPVKRKIDEVEETLDPFESLRYKVKLIRGNV